MVKFNYTQMRWIAWTVIVTAEYPEMGNLQDSMNSPGQVAGLLAMYFLLGLVLEFSYRLLVLETIFPPEKRGDEQRSDPVEAKGWKSFVDQSPPEDLHLDILCADGQVRKGKVIATSLKGRLIFEIEYEMAIRQQQKEDPMRFAPRYWRASNHNHNEKGGSDVF